MQRRTFLKLSAYCSFLALQGTATAKATQAKTYNGPLWIMIHASGGWDPTSFCDPKGILPEELDTDGNVLPTAKPMNNYLASDIKKIGNISYAPLEGIDTFFEKYYEELLVINGINPHTNGHDGGTRSVWSGKLAEGYPSIGAAIAGTYAPSSAMSYISQGGYDFTDNLVAPTRIGASNVLEELASPNLIRRNNEGIPYYYNQPHALEAIEKAHQERLNDLLKRQTMTHIKKSISQFALASSGANELKLLKNVNDSLPDELTASSNNARNLYRNARSTMAAYKAGLTVSASLSLGGFDTHNNHDAGHIPRLVELFEGVDLIKQEAKILGIEDKVIIVMGSEFGRTPGYNGNNGKDHWQVTSMLFMGKGIRGNRVIGKTTHRHQIIPLEDDSEIIPATIHRSIRRLANIDKNEAMTKYYPLNGVDMELF